MDWIIPGTALTAPREDAGLIRDRFEAMFLSGGLVLSQVATITGLEPYTIQNWVKRGYLTPPQNKHYTLRQLCRIININMLRAVLPLEHICGLLGYVNGELDDESDDMIDDSHLYFIFVQLAAHSRELYQAKAREEVLDEALAHYTPPVPEAKERVKETLRVMLTAWLAARMTEEAERMLRALTMEVVHEF